MNAQLIERYIDTLFDAASLPAAVAAQIPLPAQLPARAPEAPPKAAAARAQRWLCFEVGGTSFAVELLKVQEVQRVPPIVPVRGAPSEVLGVVNLRGEIIHAIDAAAFLGMPGADAHGEAARLIVLEDGGRRVGLFVAGVSNLLALLDDAIERCDTIARAFPCRVLLGIARHGRRSQDSRDVVVLLDARGFLS